MDNLQQAGVGGSSGFGSSGENLQNTIENAVHLSATAVAKLATCHIDLMNLQKTAFTQIKENMKRIDKVEDRLERVEAQQRHFNVTVDPLLEGLGLDSLFVNPDDIAVAVANTAGVNPIGLGPGPAGNSGAGQLRPRLKRRDLAKKPGTRDRFICPVCKRDYGTNYILHHVNETMKCGGRG